LEEPYFVHEMVSAHQFMPSVMAFHFKASICTLRPKNWSFFQALLQGEDFQSCDSFRLHVGCAAILLGATNLRLSGLPESTRTSRIAIQLPMPIPHSRDELAASACQAGQFYFLTGSFLS
jgi:hypothetical protein